MKLATIFLAVLVLAILNSCNNPSSSPESLLVGSWHHQSMHGDTLDQSNLHLYQDHTCTDTLTSTWPAGLPSVHASSGIYEARSSSILTITLGGPPADLNYYFTNNNNTLTLVNASNDSTVWLRQ
jgi:hypothetical protein